MNGDWFPENDDGERTEEFLALIRAGHESMVFAAEIIEKGIELPVEESLAPIHAMVTAALPTGRDMFEFVLFAISYIGTDLREQEECE